MGTAPCPPPALWVTSEIGTTRLLSPVIITWVKAPGLLQTLGSHPVGVAATGRGDGLRAGCNPCWAVCALGPVELPLPPLHDDAAPGRDLPVLCPVQGAGSVLQPQGPRGAELDGLPQESSSHRYRPAWGRGRGGHLESHGPRTRGLGALPLLSSCLPPQPGPASASYALPSPPPPTHTQCSHSRARGGSNGLVVVWPFDVYAEPTPALETALSRVPSLSWR